MGTHGRRTASLLVVALLGVAFLALAGAPRALAHAQLLSSTPADGASVATLPAVATLTFSEDINPDFAQTLVQGSGDPITVSPQVKGPVVTVPLPSDLGAGKIAVRYRVVSKDGHPISGEIDFTVASPASVAPGGSAGTSGGTGSASPPATSTPGASGASGGGSASATHAAGTSAVSDAGTNVVPYVLTSVMALALIGFGLLLWRSEKARQTP